MAEADPRVLERFYDRHVRAMYGLALRILQNQGDAEAVVHAVFTDAWSRMQQSDGAPEPAAALLAATRRRAIDQLRARSASAPEDPAVVDLPMPAIGDGRLTLPADAI